MKVRLSVLALMAMAGSAVAQNLKIEKFTLPNGMVVILNEDHRLPLGTVNLWYRVGSKDESTGRSGFAHLFEHLMFMGTDRAPNSQFDKIMEAEGGSSNASTWFDRTNFYEVGPSKLIPTFIWLEADRMEMLGKAMTEKKLNLQRDVVRNERRETTENVPYGPAENAITELIYPAGHPYHINIIGTHEDLEAANVKDVKDFFAKFYVPNNCSMVVSGDFDPVAVKAEIVQMFGSLPRQDDPIHRDAVTVPVATVRRITMSDPHATNPKTYMAWTSPAAYQKGDSDMSIAGSVLADGVSSQLYKKLIDEKKIATSVNASQVSLILGSWFQIDATAVSEDKLDEVERTIDEVITDFIAKGPTPEEVQRQAAKSQLGIASAIQNLQARADLMNSYQYFYGDPDSFKRDLDRYKNATPQSVQAATRDTLKLDHRVIMRVLPQVVAQGPSPRDKQPGIGADGKITFPAPTDFKLSNGVNVHFWPRPDVPLVNISIALKEGTAGEPIAKRGATSEMAELITRGAGGRSAEDVQNELDRLGAAVSFNPGLIGTTAGMSCLDVNFAKALDIFSDEMFRPNLDPKEWASLQAENVAGLENLESDPAHVSDLVMAKVLYGKSTYHGTPDEGTAAGTKNLTLDDLKAQYQRVFGNPQMEIFISGNVDQKTAQHQLERAFGKVKGSPFAFGAGSPVSPVAQNSLRVFVMDSPGAPQTAIRMAFPSEAYGGQNRLALRSITTLFGGTFTSRLNADLREDKGYTYGAGVQLAQSPVTGYSEVQTSVRTDVTGASLKEILDQIKKISGGDITSAEARMARATLQNAYVEGISSLGGTVSTAARRLLMGSSFGAQQAEYNSLGDIRETSLNPLVKKMFPLNKGVLVMVGDWAQIQKQLAGLDLPKPVLVGTLQK